MAGCSTLVKDENLCPENGSNMGPLKFWANPVMIMMLELQHFASVVLLLHAEITAHASVSFLFLAALLLFTSRGTKHSVRGVVCTELAAHRFPVEESSRFWLYFMRIALYFCYVMFQSRLKDCAQDDWIFLKFEQQQRQVVSNTSGRVKYNQWKFGIGSIWSSGGSRSVLRLPGCCCSGSLSSRWHTSYFLCCTWMHHWTSVASHTNLNMASIVPNHTHRKWRYFFPLNWHRFILYVWFQVQK